MSKIVYTLVEPETNWTYEPTDLNSAFVRLTDECLVPLTNKRNDGVRQ